MVAFKILFVLLAFIFCIVIAFLIAFNIKATAIFIEKAGGVLNGYDKVFKDLLSKQIENSDTTKEATYYSITIRYNSYASLSDSFQNLIEEAIHCYCDMDPLYQNVPQANEMYSRLIDIKQELNLLRKKYCEDS